jgi:FMN phosphatase YigB (HAD superfamily)
MKAYLGDSYEKLILGKSTELVFFKKLLSETKSSKKPENIKKEFLKEFKPIFEPENLEKAREFFKFALCSNFYYPWYNKIKSENKISFDYEAISSREKIKKEDKEMYLSIMIKMKLTPEECLVASDETSNLNLAKSLGMKTLFIKGKTKNYPQADYTYSSFNDFLKVLF